MIKLDIPTTVGSRGGGGEGGAVEGLAGRRADTKATEILAEGKNGGRPASSSL